MPWPIITLIIEVHGVYSLASYVDRRMQWRVLCGSVGRRRTL